MSKLSIYITCSTNYGLSWLHKVDTYITINSTCLRNISDVHAAKCYDCASSVTSPHEYKKNSFTKGTKNNIQKRRNINTVSFIYFHLSIEFLFLDVVHSMNQLVVLTNWILHGESFVIADCTSSYKKTFYPPQFCVFYRKLNSVTKKGFICST